MIDDITIYNLSLFSAGNDLNELYASAYDYKKHFLLSLLIRVWLRLQKF